MFKKNKTDYKAKLEHKLYLARENPEPIFDLCDCGLKQVPSGIYSLCRVFLKESLFLNNNKLTSLTAGGQLRDLSGLKVLNLQLNSFSSLPDDLSPLTNLKELYLNNNNLKQLPESIGLLRKLTILDISYNALRTLPDQIGDLNHLQSLLLVGNKHLSKLPKTLCHTRRLTNLKLDSANMIYPPSDVCDTGTENIMRYICHDNGIDYESSITDHSPEFEVACTLDEGDFSQNSALQEKIWEFENLKRQKQQEILKFEREYETYQRQELEVQAAVKANRQKFLCDLTEQQTKLESELEKIQQKKEAERCRLILDLREEEIKTDLAISNLLILIREPLSQLLEQERLEEEKLLAAATRHSDNLRRNDVLDAMRTLLEEETSRFQEYDQTREETARSILAQEMMSDSRLADVLRTQCEQQAELVSQLQMDMELQRMAVGALLERGDARSWSLIQQVHLVECQLAKLTAIEMDRKKLEMDQQVNDLAEKRANLSFLLVDLLEQQGTRRAQLLSTLQNMEAVGQSQQDFWLIQYQQLLDRRPTKLTDVQKNIDPEFAQELLLAGVIHYLPFLAEWVQTTDSSGDLTEDQLLECGIKNSEDRRMILIAYRQYCMLKYDGKKLDEPATPGPSVLPSAPAASPKLEHSSSIYSTECVVCMDSECEIIFVPCGHLCCCTNCTATLTECPLCRSFIERKIKVLLP